MNLGKADDDIVLSHRIGNDVNIVPHVRKGLGHLSDGARRAVIGREWTCGYHRDGIAFHPIPLFLFGLSSLIFEQQQI